MRYDVSAGSVSAWNPWAHPGGMKIEFWASPSRSNDSQVRYVGDAGRRSTTTSKTAPGAPDQLALAEPHPQVQAADDPLRRARQAVLDEGVRVHPRLPGHRGVERAAEEAPVVPVHGSAELDQSPDCGICELHRPILRGRNRRLEYHTRRVCETRLEQRKYPL